LGKAIVRSLGQAPAEQRALKGVMTALVCGFDQQMPEDVALRVATAEELG
jgi:hypothetical protein